MNIALEREVEITTVKYEGKEVFKSVEFRSGNETEMDNLNYKTVRFELKPEHKDAEKYMVYYNGTLNAEGYDEFHRFISSVNDFDFFLVENTTRKIVF